MGLSSTASSTRPDAGHRSIRSIFVTTVVVPALVLVLIWLACVGLMVSSVMMGHGYLAQHKGLTGVSVAAVGTLVIIAVIALAAGFARRLTRDVSNLALTAQQLTTRQLTTRQAAQAAGRGRGAAPALGPVTAPPGRATAEVARAGAAMIGLQSSAAAAASSEANLRNGLREVFVSMARRNQSLLQRQLRLIDALEQKASDPAALADLFSLDHLTTRMRRHAESLAILSGAAPGRAWRDPVPVIDVVRGAMAEVEDYKRVTVLTRSEDSITGAAVADMIHLLAELIENATLFSPSGTRVEVRAGRVANGFAVEIDDRGLGVEPEQLAEINRQLASPPDFDLANADRLGLFVGGKLAARHGVRVALRASPYGGTTAIVLMPDSIVVPPPDTAPDGFPADSVLAEMATAGRPAGLDLNRSAALTTAARPAADDRLVTASGDGSPPLPSRRSAGRPATNLGPARTPTASVSDHGVPDPDRSRLDLPGAGTAGPDDDTYHGLPRRTRQASLSPHLRESAPASGRRNDARAGLPPDEIPAPEHARNLASSLQSGWQRGRASNPAGAPGPAGVAEPGAPETTSSEDVDE